MYPIHATYFKGKVLFDRCVDWPDGQRLEISVCDQCDQKSDQSRVSEVRPTFLAALRDQGSQGLDESWWPLSQVETELLVAEMDATPPLDLSENEILRMENQWRVSREQQKQMVKESWNQTDGLFE